MADDNDQGTNDQGDGEPKAGDDGKITMTQGELNTMMADNRRKLTSKNTEMAEQLETLQGQVKMSDEERDTLTQTIESIRAQGLSEKELSKRDLAKKDAKHQDTITGLEKDVSGWKTKYTGAEIRRSIVDAVSHEDVRAYNAEQMVDLLEGKTQLVFNEDGEQSIVVSLAGQDAEGKPIDLALSPVEAMKSMKEQDRHANLFMPKGSAGLGAAGNVGDGSEGPDMSNMASYMEFRKNHPEAAGLQ